MKAGAAEIDPELARCLRRNAARPAADITRMTPQEARRVYAESRVPWNTKEPDMAEVRRGTLQLGGEGMRFVQLLPYDPRPGKVVYLHGGGWVTGSVATHDGIMRRIAEGTRRSVMGFDYPLAPEVRRAGILEACLSAVRCVRAAGKGPLVLGGDSAGAELALSVALAMRDAGEGMPDGLFLAYPALWPRFDTPSHVRSGDGRFGLATETMKQSWRLYLGEEAALPARPELAGLPPCFVLGAALDCLLDDAMDLSRMLEAEGVARELVVPGGSTHGFLHYSAAARIAMDAHEAIARFIRSCCEGS